MTKNFFLSSFAFVLGTSFAGGESFEIEKVADGVYAAIPRPGVPVGSNAAFIVNEDDVLVVDTHLRPSYARELLEEIKHFTPLPVKYVVNTHWHNDHTQGNQAYFAAFPRGVEFLSHILTREDIIGRAIPSIKTSLESLPGQIAELEKKLPALSGEEAERTRQQISQQKAYLDELKQIEISLPTLTFDRSAILHKAARDIQLLYFGRGHTRGDVVVYLPKERVVVMGDLLTGGIPFARDGYPSEWADVLSQTQKLDFATVIPGHGKVRRGKQVFTDRVSFIRELVAQVKKAAAEGKSADQIKAFLELGKFEPSFDPDASGRLFRERLGLFIDRAFAEAKGELK